MLNTMHNKDLGYSGESVARAYYEKRGWQLLVQNKAERGSELDLVMWKEDFSDDIPKDRTSNQILFVEVKSLEVGNVNNLTPEDNFTKAKQRNFKRGIELYLVKNKINTDNVSIRIDLACVYYHKNQNKWTIKVYENIILD